MKIGKTLNATLLVGALLLAVSGCQKKEGPAEHAGKELDKATAKVGQQVEKAGDKIQDAAQGNKK